MLKWINIFPFFVLFSLSACAVGTNYQPPGLEFVKGWDKEWNISDNDKDAASVTFAAVNPNGALWEQLRDDQLSELVRLARDNNNDLKVANARIAEAQANERASFATLLPQFNAEANAGRQTLGSSFGNRLDNTSQVGLSGNWELDFAGGNRRRLEAARAATQSVMEEKEGTLLALLAEVERNYVLLRSAQRQRELTERNLDLQRETLTATTAQREEGAVSDYEVARARAQADATEARLPLIDKAIVAAVNRLAVLTGEDAGKLKAMLGAPKPIPVLPAEVVAAMPLDVIARRPDVRAAKRRLAEAAALSNAAFAQFFPKITLQGFLGAQDSHIFGSASPWSAAVNGVLPLLNFGSIRAQVDAANARQNQAFYNYRQTVLLALEETGNALEAYLAELRRRETLQRVADSQGQAANIVREQFLAGVTTQLDLLVTERDKLDAETDLVLSEQAAAENLILLYRALGKNGTPVMPPKVAKVKTETNHDGTLIIR